MSAPGARPRPLLGIALILATAACFATLDTSAKRLGALLPVLVILWSRYAFQATAMALWLARARHRHLLRAEHPRFGSGITSLRDMSLHRSGGAAFSSCAGCCCSAPARWASTACSTCRSPSSRRS